MHRNSLTFFARAVGRGPGHRRDHGMCRNRRAGLDVRAARTHAVRRRRVADASGDGGR